MTNDLRPKKLALYFETREESPGEFFFLESIFTAQGIVDKDGKPTPAIKLNFRSRADLAARNDRALRAQLAFFLDCRLHARNISELRDQPYLVALEHFTKCLPKDRAGVRMLGYRRFDSGDTVTVCSQLFERESGVLRMKKDGLLPSHIEIYIGTECLRLQDKLKDLYRWLIAPFAARKTTLCDPTFWHSRSDGMGEVQGAIKNAQREIFAAGFSLNSLLTFFDARRCALTIAEHDDFTITFVLAHEWKPREKEPGGKNVEANVETSRRTLVNAREELIERLTEIMVDRKVKDAKTIAAKRITQSLSVLRYNDIVHPHNFLVQADSAIFVGPYLSHAKGREFCLFRFRENEQPAYEQLKKEVRHIKDKATAVPRSFWSK